MMRKSTVLKVVPALLVTVFFFYLPTLLNPNLLLSRGNDLQEQFWPVFYFIKQTLSLHHQVPLWNNLFFAGMPILPDPQFSLLYPPNWLMLVLPINLGFFAYFMFHSLLSGVTSYLLVVKGMKLSVRTSLIVSLIYLTTPRVTGYIESGHYGLVAAHAWLPLVALSVVCLARSAKFKYALVLAISFAGLFYSHTVIATLAVPFSVGLLLVLSVVFFKREAVLRKLFFFVIAFGITFCVTAPTLLPQLEWIPSTTRSLLARYPDVYPKWSSSKEFISALVPLVNTVNKIESEKLLTVGIATLIFALIGFCYLSAKAKVVSFVFIAGSLLIILNNLSPLYSTLLFEDWYALMRVTTRFWFVFGTLAILIAGIGIEKLLSKKSKLTKVIAFGLVSIALLENLNISVVKLENAGHSTPRFVGESSYLFAEHDTEKFRVLCTTRCISQKEAAKRGLELIEGYNTFQQLNYYKEVQKLMGVSWKTYTLAFPPVDVTRINPNAKLLGEYNTKYIVSPYPLVDENFRLKTEVDKFLVYENELYMPRAYTLKKDHGYIEAPIETYAPNYIRVNTIEKANNALILSEVYSRGWTAYLDGKEQVEVTQTENALRKVLMKDNTIFVEFRYMPKSFVLGVRILLIFIVTSTIGFVAYIKVKKWEN